MKKSLLLSAMAIAAVMPAMAVTDGETYENINGLTCTNLWIDAVYHNPAGWNALPWMADDMMGKARTACLGKYDGKNAVLVGYSKTMSIDDAPSNDYAHIVIMDFLTGEVIKTQQVTVDGQPIAGLLCANQVGFDQFGHAWLAGYVATMAGETGKAPLKIYNVDLETGAATLAASLEVSDEAYDEISAGSTRIDYCDLVGDITLEKAGCNVMAAIASGSNNWVLGWGAEQGGEEWTGNMDGQDYRAMSATYPAGVANWNTAPCVRIVLDEDYTNNLFYVDGFSTCASLYKPNGTMIDDFGQLGEEVDGSIVIPEDKQAWVPATGTNGIGEFSIAGENFIVYSLNQYVSPGFCAINVCSVGEDMSFASMEKYWTLPTDGLGNVSDGGLRIHPVEARNYMDANGKEAAYILTYKAANGVGVYVVAQEGFDMDSAQEEDETGSVADAMLDNSNAPVEYFNLQGVRVSNPAAGQLLIRRQGTEVSKVLVK